MSSFSCSEKETHQYSSRWSSWFQRGQHWLCFPFPGYLLLKSAQKQAGVLDSKTGCFLHFICQGLLSSGRQTRLIALVHCYWMESYYGHYSKTVSVCTCNYASLCVHVYMYVYISICVYVCMCTQTYVHRTLRWARLPLEACNFPAIISTTMFPWDWSGTNWWHREKSAGILGQIHSENDQKLKAEDSRGERKLGGEVGTLNLTERWEVSTYDGGSSWIEVYFPFFIYFYFTQRTHRSIEIYVTNFQECYGSCLDLFLKVSSVVLAQYFATALVESGCDHCLEDDVKEGIQTFSTLPPPAWKRGTPARWGCGRSRISKLFREERWDWDPNGSSEWRKSSRRFHCDLSDVFLLKVTLHSQVWSDFFLLPCSVHPDFLCSLCSFSSTSDRTTFLFAKETEYVPMGIFSLSKYFHFFFCYK